jgi:hypothetical protein
MNTSGCQIDVYLPTNDRAQALLDAITDLLVFRGLGVDTDGQVHAMVALRSFPRSDNPKETLDSANNDEAIAVSVPTNAGIHRRS